MTMRSLSRCLGVVTGTLWIGSLLFAGPAYAVVVPHFVKGAFGVGFHVGGAYDAASISVFIDPARTNWIAWNNAPTVLTHSAPCSVGEPFAGSCLGPFAGSTDDSIDLTVTNPDGISLTVDFDQNDGFNRPLGQQGVIFGNKDAAPDVFRNDFANAPYYLDEAGAHNALFTKAGMYDFQFSWQNDLCCGAGHHDTWLLVDANPAQAPEPSALALLGAGLAALAGLAHCRRK